MKKKKIWQYSLVASLLVSLFIHLLLLPLKIKLVASKKKKPERIKLILREKDKKQIVSSHRQNKSTPTKTNFLSKDDNRTDTESKARIIDSFREAAKGTKDGKVSQHKQASPQKKRKKTRPLNKKLTLKDLSFNRTQQSHQIQASVQGVQTGVQNIAPGLAQNNDYMEDIPLGDITNLNTQQSKYYGFYFRIKQKVEQFWSHSLRQKATNLYRSGRSLASNHTKITSLRITLDTMGNVVNIFVKKTSGIQELDQAAVESFNKAGPFPNPPKEMVKNGVAIIEWGFVVKS